MATFTPDTNFQPGSNQRDWAYHLACLPQTAPIIFTKAGLIDFLKTHGVEVDPNYTELAKVPKYATVGSFNGDYTATTTSTDAPPTSATVPEVSPSTTTSNAHSAPRAAPAAPSTTDVSHKNTAVITPEGDSFRPTRRVREAIGGGSDQILSLFGGADDDDEQTSSSRRGAAAKAPGVAANASNDEDDRPMTEGAKRRARAEAERAAANGTSAPTSTSTANGEDKENGVKSAAAAPDAPAKDEAFASASRTQAQLAKDMEAAVPAFRPTRRVREAGGTGGQSSITLG